MDESVKSCQKSSDPIIRQATHRFDQGSSAAQVPWIRWSFSFVGVGSTTTTLNLLNKGHSFQRTSLKFQRFFCCPLFLSLRYRKNLTSCPLFFKNYILPLVVRLIFFNKNQILKIIHFAFSSKVDFFIKNRHNS